MSNELRAVNVSGETCFALIFNRSGELWNGSTFETFALADFADYDVALTEVGSTGIYQGDFPTGITAAGTYEYIVKKQSGVSPAQDDSIIGTGTVDWTGVASASASAGSLNATDWLAYFLRGGFKRTDKTTEIYEETTDAIQELRRRFMFDEAKIETTTTDTISVLGDYQIDVESDLGLLLSVRLDDGTNSVPLTQLSKKQFDDKYTAAAVTNDRGYPADFCVFNSKIQIGPVPDQTGYLYRLAYSSRAGVITNSTTSVPFTALYRDLLRYNVNGRMYRSMDEFDKATYFETQFEKGFLFATRRERLNAREGAFNVKPFGM